MPTSTQIIPISLSQLTSQIVETIGNAFGNHFIWVMAEISNFQPNNGWHFFELVEKDEMSKGVTSKISAVAWRLGSARIRAFEKSTGKRFATGIKVCLLVKVEFHPSYGLKAVVYDIDPAYTIGQLEVQRQNTINRLLEECSAYIKKNGDKYITKNNSIQLATVIQQIAVISSNASAGYADFMDVLAKNRFGYRFIIHSFFTSVQGEENAQGIVDKILEISNSEVKYDAVILIRGGGADTDFLIFEQFNLCAAVAKLHIPVITGIGHLKNQSIVDLLAHSATNAPTKAAEFIIAHNLAFETLLLTHQKNIVIKSQQVVNRHQRAMLSIHATISRNSRTLVTERKNQVEKIEHKIRSATSGLLHHHRIILQELSNKVSNKPFYFISAKKVAIENESVRLKKTIHQFVVNQKRNITEHETVCRLLSPVNILKKGFALVYKEGNITTSGETIDLGSEIKVRMYDSEIFSTVTEKTKNNGDQFNL